MNDTIFIRSDLAQDAIVLFVRTSALAHCTSIAHLENGRVAVTTSWPVAGFSTGEVIAWSVLRSLVEGELRRLLDRCDTDTIGALIGCLALTREAIAA